MNPPLERDPRTHEIIGAAMEVHRELGCGFLEPVYHAALAIEFETRDLPFEHENEVPVHYRGCKLDVKYRADFICYGSVIVEVKALSRLSSIEESQLINYLKGTGIELGLLINFGGRSLEWKRFIRSDRGKGPQISQMTQI